jgi:hypothetical protein
VLKTRKVEIVVLKAATVRVFVTHLRKNVFANNLLKFSNPRPLGK